MRGFPNNVIRVTVALIALFSLFYFLKPLPAELPPSLARTGGLFRRVHPIEKLHRQALRRHEALVARQSADLESAVDSYRKRYGEEPPLGFEHWFKQAKDANSSIIDDFDLTREQLTPFSHYLANKYDLNLTSADKMTLSSARLLQVCFGEGDIKFEGYQEEWYVQGLKTMLKSYAHELPPLCILVNLLDEPREVLPDGVLPSHLQPEGHSLSFRQFTGHTKLWSELSLPCWSSSTKAASHRSLSQVWSNLRSRTVSKNSTARDQPRFAKDWYRNTDVCHQKSPLKYSFIQSPESAKLTHDAVPILSPAKLSTFADIVFPSVWRFEEGHDEDEVDPVWVDKRPQIYWRGSTTGGHAAGGSWRKLHRQALIEEMLRHFQGQRDALNVAFTDAIQCDDVACQEERQELPMAEREPRSEGWKHKIVLDIDGNGLSGRLYDLLRSNSAVLRYSFMREWHDERLQPWLHFIPLTSEASETREIADYFLNTERGGEILKTIADESKRWAERSLRREDMQLYLWRLLLEMSRGR